MNTNRSDRSKMYNINQKPLAQLRPEKLDDASIKEQIVLIHEVCNDVSLDEIAVVFDECNYNMQNTIARIEAGDFGNGGWQTARSSNKKKHITNQTSDQTVNSSAQNDNEQPPSQHISSTSLLRDNVRQQVRQSSYYHHTKPFMHSRRRRNHYNRSHFNQSNPYHSSRDFPSDNNNNKYLSNQESSNETSSSTKNEDSSSKTPQPSPTDGYDFIIDGTQTLMFDNSLTKALLSASTKHLKPSSIPEKPVVMHPTIQLSTQDIDIQFGDIIWNDSIPTVASPSDSFDLTKSFDDQRLSSLKSTNNNEQQTNVQSNISSKYTNHPTSDELNRKLMDAANRLSSASSSSSSLPVTNNTLITTLPGVPLNETSHFSDQLADSLQQQASLKIVSSSSSLSDTTNLLSTSNVVHYPSSALLKSNQFTSYTFPPSLTDTNTRPDGMSSAFAPYNTHGIYSSIPRESQTTSMWSQQQPNYKHNSKSIMNQSGNFSQQASHQQHSYQPPFYFAPYFATASLYPVLTAVDPWSTGGYEPYTGYSTANNLPNYAHQSQYQHPAHVPSNKYDRASYDKEFFANYGQTRLPNTDSFNTSQAVKDAAISSKLSPNAASFSQGASFASTNMYPNPFTYQYSHSYTTPPERTMTYTSVNNRDNRIGASHTGSNNRNHYFSQQRTHNNSTWYQQQ